MKKIKFYMCNDCGNVITATGEAEVACCGRKLTNLAVGQSDEEYDVNIETVETDYYITFSHEMSKEHYISFIAYVTYDRVMVVKLYPEQAGEVRFPMFNRGKLYLACNQHGLKINNIP